MRIDRSMVLRALNLISVSDITDVVINQDGTVCHPSPDRTLFVYGDLELEGLDEAWAIPDIGLLQRMLKQFQSPEIDVSRSRNSFLMQADGIKWNYRLGSQEAIQKIQSDAVEQILADMAFSCTVTVDVLKKVQRIQSVVKAAYIHFVSKEGKFFVVVGEKDTYAGATDLELSPEIDFNLKVPAGRLIEVIEKIDDAQVSLQFWCGTKKLIRVQMPKFGWIIGAIKE